MRPRKSTSKTKNLLSSVALGSVEVLHGVENIPKSVLSKVVDRIDWNSTAGYLRHLDTLPLGPNIVPLLRGGLDTLERTLLATRQALTVMPTTGEVSESPQSEDGYGDDVRIQFAIVLGAMGEAIEAYDSAAKFSPESMGVPQQAWFGKGEVYLKMDKNDAALEAFRQAIELYPLDYDAWHGKGLAFKATGKRIEADMAFEVAEKLGYKA